MTEQTTSQGVKTDRKPVLFSGIQPTGHITLGNYIGAIRNFTLLEKDYDCLFCVVDLHALTVRQVPAELRRKTMELAALYIASGLDPVKNLIYCQSHVPEHAELSWLLNCFTYMGELSRMTQFKDKSARHKDNVNAGLLTYPVLMAADILLFQSALVPVGIDQKQHLELSRDIAQRVNAIHPNMFTVPEPYITKETAKIMSLAEPDKKMSKSDENPDAAVSLLDKPEDIRRKFKRAVTDSETEIRYDPDNKPGVSNLLTILSVLGGQSIDSLQNDLAGRGYGVLKERTAEAVIAALAPIQANFNALMQDKGYLSDVLKNNAQRASAMGRRTLSKFQKKLGLLQV